MGGHGHMQVIGPNGAVLPPGTYHLEVPRDHLHKGGPGQQRFAYPPGGRGGRSGRGLGPFPGRGGVPVGGRGMGQARVSAVNLAGRSGCCTRRACKEFCSVVECSAS